MAGCSDKTWSRRKIMRLPETLSLSVHRRAYWMRLLICWPTVRRTSTLSVIQAHAEPQAGTERMRGLRGCKGQHEPSINPKPAVLRTSTSRCTSIAPATPQCHIVPATSYQPHRIIVLVTSLCRQHACAQQTYRQTFSCPPENPHSVILIQRPCLSRNAGLIALLAWSF